ncbi:P-loop containing nucleoside triphosphate hydrolase protein [Xylariaceae sp. FL1272]|nr:P-loop containing nucleoside triphosphate hydrolase protein [Xylariaceae sp. FL1272]
MDCYDSGGEWGAPSPQTKKWIGLPDDKHSGSESASSVDGSLVLQSLGREAYNGVVCNLYHHLCLAGSCPPRWSEHAQLELEQKELLDRTTDSPLIHRWQKNGKRWVSQCFSVQDPSMRTVLDEVLKDYDLLTYSYDTPYKPLCHRWEALAKYHDEVQSSELKSAASDLRKFLSPVLRSTLDSMKRLRETGKIHFQELWQIFDRGMLVVARVNDVETVCQVTFCAGDQHSYFMATIRYLDWDGVRVGFKTLNVEILPFGELKRVNSLPLFPLSFHEDEPGFRKSILMRGRVFEQICLAEWTCSKLDDSAEIVVADGAKRTLETEQPEAQPVRGMVCIDPHAYYTSCKVIKPSLGAVSGDDTMEARRIRLTDEQCLLTSPWVKGFDLKAKDFCEFRVDQLTNVNFTDEAYRNLVLPNGDKELMWEFCEAKKITSAATFDDFIVDKGRGFITLMYGPPGCGKTLTAEAIAHKLRVPLYMMGAGDLGTQASAITASLSRALWLCSRWNGILLLDEADVYLAARRRTTLQQNELVSLFLRELEYYPGIMILTTNRIETIDTAFQSRVDLFLPYSNLSKEARRQVWDSFIDRAGRDMFDVTDEGLDRLSDFALNGREIKNLVKSAKMLSVIKNGTKISAERLSMLAEKRLIALEAVESSAQGF